MNNGFWKYRGQVCLFPLTWVEKLAAVRLRLPFVNNFLWSSFTRRFFLRLIGCFNSTCRFKFIAYVADIWTCVSHPAGTICIKNVFVFFVFHGICTELVIKLLQIFTLTFFSSTGICAWIGGCTSHANELTTLTFISCKWFSSLFTKNGVVYPCLKGWVFWGQRWKKCVLRCHP